jgi:hypothetical protein
VTVLHAATVFIHHFIPRPSFLSAFWITWGKRPTPDLPMAEQLRAREQK